MLRPHVPALAVAVLAVCHTSGLAQVAPGNNMTPQQMQAIINMRALQMRGGGGVRTGYPQDIQFGAPQQQPDYSQIQDQANQERKASSQKRIEARKALEEKKKAARDEANAKKGKGKAKLEQADAKDAKKPAAKTTKSGKKAEPIKSSKPAKKPADEKAAQ